MSRRKKKAAPGQGRLEKNQPGQASKNRIYSATDSGETQAAPFPKMSSRPFLVGDGFTVRFTTKKGYLQCIWTPDVPTRHDQKKIDMAKYEQALLLFLTDLAREVQS